MLKRNSTKRCLLQSDFNLMAILQSSLILILMQFRPKSIQWHFRIWTRQKILECATFKIKNVVMDLWKRRKVIKTQRRQSWFRRRRNQKNRNNSISLPRKKSALVVQILLMQWLELQFLILWLLMIWKIKKHNFRINEITWTDRWMRMMLYRKKNLKQNWKIKIWFLT